MNTLWRSAITVATLVCNVPLAIGMANDSSVLAIRTLHRRAVLINVMSAFTAMPPIAHSESDDLERLCSGGALAGESAIPGAYQQPCMMLPVRSIPVQNGQVNLSIEQGGAAAGSTGMAVWNSSLVLERLLERLTGSQPDWLAGKTVLELGCGAGLVSLSAAVLGAAKVLATDGNLEVLELAQRNVERNLLTDRVSASRLQWGMMDAIELSDVADVVLGADLTYSPGSWRLLAETMETVLKRTGFVVYLSLGHTGFNVNAEVEGFLAVAKELGLISLLPSDTVWPFPGLSTPLADLLLRDSLTSTERRIIDGTGGLRVLILGKKRLKKTGR